MPKLLSTLEKLEIRLGIDTKGHFYLLHRILKVGDNFHTLIPGYLADSL